jgi:hypothetical protein
MQLPIGGSSAVCIIWSIRRSSNNNTAVQYTYGKRNFIKSMSRLVVEQLVGQAILAAR